MTDPDVQHLRDLAKGYANSFIDGWKEEYAALMRIAQRLEFYTQQPTDTGLESLEPSE